MLRARAAPHRLRRLLRHALPQAALRGAGAADGGRLLLLRRRARALLEPQDPARARGRLPARRAAPLPRRGTRRSCLAWRCALSPRRYDAVVKSLNGQADAPARLRRQPRARAAVRAVDRDVAPPAHRLPPRQRGRSRATSIAAPRRSWPTASTSSATSSRRPTSTRARSSWPARRSSPSASPPSSRRATARPRCSSSASSRSARASPTCSSAFDALDDARARLRLVGNGSLEPEVDAARGAGPARGRRRLPAPGAPSRDARAAPAASCCRRSPRRSTASRGASSSTRRCTPACPSSPPTPSARRRAAWSATRPTASIVPERDPAALTAAIRRLTADAALAARLGDQARRDVARFSHARHGRCLRGRGRARRRYLVAVTQRCQPARRPSRRAAAIGSRRSPRG